MTSESDRWFVQMLCHAMRQILGILAARRKHEPRSARSESDNGVAEKSAHSS